MKVLQHGTNTEHICSGDQTVHCFYIVEKANLP